MKKTYIDEVLARFQLTKELGLPRSEDIPELAKRLKKAIEKLKAYTDRSGNLITKNVDELINELEAPLGDKSEISLLEDK